MEALFSLFLSLPLSLSLSLKEIDTKDEKFLLKDVNISLSSLFHNVYAPTAQI